MMLICHVKNEFTRPFEAFLEIFQVKESTKHCKRQALKCNNNLILHYRNCFTNSLTIFHISSNIFPCHNSHFLTSSIYMFFKKIKHSLLCERNYSRESFGYNYSFLLHCRLVYYFKMFYLIEKEIYTYIHEYLFHDYQYKVITRHHQILPLQRWFCQLWTRNSYEYTSMSRFKNLSLWNFLAKKCLKFIHFKL